MKKPVLAGIGGAVVVVAVIATMLLSQPDIERPWEGMSCEEMVDLAMSPEHNTFSPDQHMEFHKALVPCIEETGQSVP